MKELIIARINNVDIVSAVKEAKLWCLSNQFVPRLVLRLNANTQN